MSPRGPRRELFARQTRKNEEVYVDTRPSDDAGWRANRPCPEGWPPMAAREWTGALRPTGGQVKPQAIVWQPSGANAGYVETLNRLYPLP
jgi:hypothetical protein